MCGIAGLLGREDKAVVRQMTDRIAHRGPDGEGQWSDAGLVTLGHRRLSIVDLEGGAQPMESLDGRYCIVYNGETYNHEPIRRELEAKGHQFRTDHSDTEVILEAYRAWGPSFVERLEGMFAFAIWDTQDQTLFIARDPFGIKPFFCRWTKEGDWIFNSEVKGLQAHDGWDPVVDVCRIKERIALEFLVGQGTLLEGVHQLPPGTWALLDPKTFTPGKEIPFVPYMRTDIETYDSPQQAMKEIYTRFQNSVEEQLMSDVPLGVILSGGLDSAAVAAAYAKASDAPIRTFTIGEGDQVEDVRRARQLAEHLGANHHETSFTAEDYHRELPRYVWANENINYTEFFFQPLFEFTRKHVTVALCGQGSDELWGGYARYKDPRALAMERIRRIDATDPSHGCSLRQTVISTHRHGAALAEWDQQGQLNNFQLRLVDRNSMASSLEVRVPFLSKPLAQISHNTSWGWKIRDGVEKWILREALEELKMPKDLTWRPKVPAGRSTAPGVVETFESWAERNVGRHAPTQGLEHAFPNAAEAAVYRLWHHHTVECRGAPNTITLEDLL